MRVPFSVQAFFFSLPTPLLLLLLPSFSSFGFSIASVAVSIVRGKCKDVVSVCTEWMVLAACAGDRERVNGTQTETWHRERERWSTGRLTWHMRQQLCDLDMKGGVAVQHSSSAMFNYMIALSSGHFVSLLCSLSPHPFSVIAGSTKKRRKQLACDSLAILVSFPRHVCVCVRVLRPRSVYNSVAKGGTSRQSLAQDRQAMEGDKQDA